MKTLIKFLKILMNKLPNTLRMLNEVIKSLFELIWPTPDNNIPVQVERNPQLLRSYFLVWRLTGQI